LGWTARAGRHPNRWYRDHVVVVAGDAHCTNRVRGRC
jgi:hypothetical protein